MAIRTYNLIVVKPFRPTPNVTMLSPTPIPTPDPLAPFSILLMGYGGGKHEGGRLTDSMIVAHINPKNLEIKLISIPRDIWMPLPINGDETKGFKINAAFAIGSDDRSYPNKKIEFTGRGGGGELAKLAVSEVVGFKIDYFIALDFQGFIKIVDVLGGIDVPVLTSFDDPMYPLETDIVDNCGKTNEEVTALTATMSGEKLENEFMCRYENLHFDKGLQHMNGVTALKFARSRHSKEDGGDFNRSIRQKQVIMAIKERVISIGFIPKIIPAINALAGNLTTDLSATKINELMSMADILTNCKVEIIPLTDQNVLTDSVVERQFVLIPRIGDGNWDEVHHFIENPTTLTPVPTASIN